MAHLLHTERDGSNLIRWYFEDGKLWRNTVDLAKPHVLQQNAEMRKPGVMADNDGMRWALSIPEDDHVMLIAKYPDLRSPDKHTHHRAWQKFMRSSESLPYRVRHWGKGRAA